MNSIPSAAFLPVEHLLPHADPMILLHGVVGCDEQSLTACVDLAQPHIFSHPQGAPAYVALEFMAQAISAYSGVQRRALNLPPQIGFLLGTRHFSAALRACLTKARRIFLSRSNSPKNPPFLCLIAGCFSPTNLTKT
jgi:predicted hotdog family 3-hydroxylacyl-ACP dehydratase